MNDPILLQAQHVSKTFDNNVVLKDISIAFKKGELVAILGASGAGKSTLLRILAGLIAPSSGSVLVQNAPLVGINPNTSMVFQNFALYPWLTVLENVELGLLSFNLSKKNAREKALQAIDVIGLKGFIDAYPKELSGGMKQRVGFARAIVVSPKILFMDEPFSALDVLTSENLRQELLMLWHEHKLPTESIVMVTHNIEEAVSMSDRLIVLSSNPGSVRTELPGLPFEDRIPKTYEHEKLVDTVFEIMTNPRENAAKLTSDELKDRAAAPSYEVLPRVTIGEIEGLLKQLSKSDGREHISTLGKNLGLGLDALLSLTEAVDLLGFAGAEDNTLILTSSGKEFAKAGAKEAKKILREALIANVALVQHMKEELEGSPRHTISGRHILDQLEKYFTPEDAKIQLHIAIEWCRFAELLTYNRELHMIHLTSGSID